MLAGRRVFEKIVLKGLADDPREASVLLLGGLSKGGLDILSGNKTDGRILFSHGCILSYYNNH